MAIASQDFRDGVATGVATLANRINTADSWGIPITKRVVDEMAENIRALYGGSVPDGAETL